MNNKTIWITSLVFMVILGFGCTNAKSNQTDEASQLSTPVTEVLSSVDVEKLMAANCYVCHNPNSSSHDVILAPPFFAVKKHYLQATDDRTEFVNGMTAFVSNPNKESALMKGPIGRFGLMPKTALNDEDIRAIVEFIYDNEIQAPSWFEGHAKEKHGKL
uniref:c-type cytochrome n=1 Tax=Fulvivirga sp. TaxID=1931237 RepID=UPI00404B916C